MDRIGIVGTGFVADLYTRSLLTFPHLKVVKAYDIVQSRLAAFCRHWKIAPAESLGDLLKGGAESPTLILNLTKPSLRVRGIYLIALALSLFGPVERIDAQLDFTESGVDKDAFLQLRHKNGGHSRLAASLDCLMSNTATLSCSGGLVRLEAPRIGSEAVSS